MINGDISMDVYIYDSDYESMKSIKEMCFYFFMKENIDAEIVGSCTSREEFDKVFEGANLLSLFFVEHYKTETLISKIREANIANYIILLLRNIGELLEGVNPSARPSGYVIKPAQKRQLELLIKGILVDYVHMVKVKDVFRFKNKAKDYTLPCDQILFFESRNKKIVVRTLVQEFEFYSSLNSIEKELPKNFLRIHKSFIVNTEKIYRIDYGDMMVEFEDETKALVSRAYKLMLQEHMANLHMK